MLDLISNGTFVQWINIIKVTISGIEWVFLGGFIALLVYCLIKGTTKEKIFFAVQSLMYIVLVLNPISCMILENKMGVYFTQRVYRFFWAFPLYFAYAYFLTKFLIRFKKNNFAKCIMLFLSVVLVVLGIYQIVEGSKHTFLSDGILTPVDNIYKIESSVIHAADLIEADKKDKNIYANVVSDGNVSMEIRAYDASLISVSTDEYFTIYFDMPCDISQEDMISILDKLDVNYIIISSSNINNDFLTGCGYVLIGETEDEESSYNVYRVKACDSNSNIKTNDN